MKTNVKRYQWQPKDVHIVQSTEVELFNKSNIKEMITRDGNKVIVKEYNEHHDEATGRFTFAKSRQVQAEPRKFMGMATDKELVDFMEEQGHIASASESDAIGKYTGSSSWWVNHKLRRGRYPEGLVSSDAQVAAYDIRVGDIVKEMDSAIGRNTTRDSFYVYRGVRMNSDLNVFEISKSFRDPGYVSTSLSRPLGESFAALPGIGGKQPIGKSYLMRILVRRGQNGILVDPVRHYGEAEFILPRGSSYTITDRTPSIINGKAVTVLDVEVY